MGEDLINAKGDLQRTLDLLWDVNMTTQGDQADIRTRVQMALNALIQNERKIWLRTRGGKEMLGDFGRVSAELLKATEHLSKAKTSDQKAIADFARALGEVELCANRLEEESRRRSMVVT